MAASSPLQNAFVLLQWSRWCCFLWRLHFVLKLMRAFPLFLIHGVVLNFILVALFAPFEWSKQRIRLWLDKSR